MIGGFQVGPFQPLPAYQQGGAPIVVIDTHDGERKRKRDAAIREGTERRREQLEVAFGVRPAAQQEAQHIVPHLPRPDLAPVITFDFDADDEEVILLL